MKAKRRGGAKSELDGNLPREERAQAAAWTAKEQKNIFFKVGFTRI
jgi:hypothetical protein